ncbi:hypothetical protein B9479_004040 [Cryptococcus floricola]|uniref:Uncharacterized protein n=1 Tax=Cryptococcus floricola TaxID=2591691 RepID=A0A5D3AV70_9TREE|nr:hypothetical protein B9479_004040 [Cryptococcus floricola]
MSYPADLGHSRSHSRSSSGSSGSLTARQSRRSSAGTVRAPSSGGKLFGLIRGKKAGQGGDDDEEEDEDVAELGAYSPHVSPSPSPGPGWRSSSVRMDHEEEMVEMEAGPSDYLERGFDTPSTLSSELYPDAGWRQPSTKPYDSDSIEEGPSDYWGPETPPIAPTHPPESSLGQSPGVNGDLYDDDEYERRIQNVLAQDELGSSPNLSTSEAEAFHPSRSRENSADIRGVGVESGRDSATNGQGESSVGEEEFGPRVAESDRDDVSIRTPSTASQTPARLREGPYPPGFTPSPSKRASFIHPSISRLRSHMRSSSANSQQSIQNPQLLNLRAPSHFSQVSAARSDTMSVSSLPSKPSTLHQEIPKPPAEPEQGPAFQFHPLRKLSTHLFSRDKKNGSGSSSPKPVISRKASSLLGLPIGSPVKETMEEQKLGRPTVLDINGMIAVGTDAGLVLVYGFGQDIKYTLGPEDPSAAVTCVTISSDETYIAVGLSTGTIHLYDLSAPARPARTAHSLSLKQIHSGRREGHLQGSRVLHIGFVGKRHTSIVSGDEHGRAFWWSLGKVMGVESTDVIRMLGSYPSPGTNDKPPYPPKKPTTLFSTTSLPLNSSAHPTDEFSLSALLTQSKLVIVGMKPQAKTWFRKMRDNSGGNEGGLMGCTAWLKSGEVVDDGTTSGAEVSDPVLAYSWGKAVRFIRARVQREGDEATPEFVEGRKWEASEGVRAMEWYDPNHLLVITSTSLVLLDVRSMKVVENTPLQTSLLTSQDFYKGLPPKAEGELVLNSFVGSVKAHRGKLFLLTKTNLQAGTLLHWNDRILTQVHRGDFLFAISVALSYYNGTAKGNTINLPSDPLERQEVVGKRMRDLMKASLEWAFSPDRMTDDTHFSADGRGVDLTSLFEGLATSCIEACLAIGDTEFLFDDAYDHYSQVGIQSIFLNVLEPFIFSNRVREIPPDIIKALITMHDEKQELDLAESIIWHVDPISLDINQAITLCELHGLWDAMIHVYTRAMRDYVAPIVKLIGVVRDIQQHRLHRPSLVGDERDGTEELAPNAYKLYAYLETVLSGLSYPSNEPLSEREAHQARTEVYSFIFQGRTVTWPQGSSELVLTVDQDHPEPPYPYLSLLLRFDTEAFLHAMDIAFEDSYLNDPSGAINRQSIVNLMLDVMDPEYFHPGDITFLHIFVARNLPKYPQFLFIPPSTLHRILVSLASDPDQSTREDRQMAAEYLLSAYTPHDGDAMLALFEQAGFFRILRGAYRREGKWGQLINTLLRDPDSDEEVFGALERIVKDASPAASSEVSQAVTEALPQLFELGVRETAVLLDKELPEVHSAAIEALGPAPHKQMAYLRCLLEPDGEETSSSTPSTNVELPNRHLYIDLLSRNDPGHVVTFLDERGPSFFDLSRLSKQCEAEHLYEAQLWALDRQGKTKETFDTIGDVLRNKGGELGEGVLGDDLGSVHLALEVIQGVAKMGVRLCQAHSTQAKDGHGAKREMEVEDMWLGILHEIIELVHASSALASSSSDGIVLDTLRSLVQETLASLVSSSSPSLSFPRLFKRLVEASTSTSKQSAKGRAYSEFRTILVGMLDSYRAEGEMLSMTTRLVEADLGEVASDFVKESVKGWRAELGKECGECGLEMNKEEQWVVGGSGRVLHRVCLTVD